jgi:hypothetical protein
MTLLDAEPYDPARDRRRRIRIASALVLILVLAWIGWMYRNWPEERAVGRFFAALQQKNFETAYGIWQHDPGWKEHSEKYRSYPLDDFYRDWGPGGEWGAAAVA